MSDTEQTFECICGIRTTGDASEIWIESPKTQKRLSVPRGWWMILPDRLVARITKCRAEGGSRLSFTMAELLEFSTAAERYQRQIVQCRRIIGRR